jgi:ribosome-associated translation inhibitor RaiA
MMRRRTIGRDTRLRGAQSIMAATRKEASRRRPAPRAATPRARTTPELPRKTRRAGTGPSGPRIYIRSVDAPLTAEDRDDLRRKLTAGLARFAPRVERASVRIEDVNGPRGGVDKRCRIKVVLSGLPSVTAEEQQPTVRAAMDRAITRVVAAVRRSVERRNQSSSARARRAPARRDSEA